MKLFNATMDVYGTDSAGRFTVKVFDDVPCRMEHVTGGNSSFERAELAALRKLMFDPSYVLPDTCQVEVAGVRWNVQAFTFGTFGRVRPLYKTAELIRAG